MAMNRVQFQPGLSMAEFMDQYGTDAQCEEALVAARWPQGFACPACGAPASCSFRRQGRLYWQCSSCRHQCSVISGTIPLRAETRCPAAPPSRRCLEVPQLPTTVKPVGSEAPSNLPLHETRIMAEFHAAWRLPVEGRHEVLTEDSAVISPRRTMGNRRQMPYSCPHRTASCDWTPAGIACVSSAHQPPRCSWPGARGQDASGHRSGQAAADYNDGRQASKRGQPSLPAMQSHRGAAQRMERTYAGWIATTARTGSA